MKKYLIFATLVAMVFVGCKKNTTAPPKKPTEKPVAAKFSGNILKGSILEGDVTATVSTRVDLEGGWSGRGADEVGVSMFAEGSERTAENVLADNIPYKVNGNGRFSPKSADIYFPTKNKVDFIAYHPYNPKVTATNHTVDVLFSSQTLANLSKMECIWATVTGQSNMESAVNFNFKRAQGLIHITIAAGSSGYPALSRWEVTLDKVPTLGTFNVKTGIVSLPSDPKPASVKLEEFAIYTEGGSRGGRLASFAWYAQLPPHQNTQFGDRLIRVTSPDKKHTYIVPLKQNVEAGKRHRIKIELQKFGEAKMTSSSITDWVETSIILNAE
ncbi:hypothetical protein BN938_2159 [Mucinivorans hirudinis]|uniref:Fimbrillin family protein n=1 Tax=Mucinivorans hirudinis TaxID=1433126 RepID=A0A060R9H2_9BACT|nr:hypothetical protein BN938_2159 [Mucinivorans hirudinis]